jgi:parallel beta-helix repeat protein
MNQIFKNSLFIIFLFFYSYYSNGATYFISAEGDDNNSGKSLQEAWRTIERVNNLMPVAGDSILFRRGDTWIGTITVKASGKEDAPIFYGAYGEGDKPLIKGSVEIKGWSNYSGNIYKASVDFPVEQLFVNGSRATIARYPDEGYLYIDSVEDDTRFISKQLDTSKDYSGATWYGRTQYWFGVIRNVTASSSGMLTLNSVPNGKLAEKQGFILMNKLEFLTQPGEWYYDEKQKTVYLWTKNNHSPDNSTVTASVHSDGMVLQHVSYVTVDNLSFAEQDISGIRLISTNKCILSNNNISNIDSYGIYEEIRPGSSNLTVINNTINKVNGGGIWMWVRDSYIADNFINNTGIFKELGLKGTTAPNGGSGAEISGVNNVIEYNVIENSNYNGLFYRGAGTDIRYNFFNNSCLYKDDGGGIYTNTSGSGATIRYNIIINSIGNPEGYISSRSMAEGIYIDEIARNVTVENNTILNAGNSGIKLHNIGNIHVKNNKVMTARYGIFCDKFVGEPSVITNNIFCVTKESDDYERRSLLVRLVKYNAQIDNNLYVNPFASEGIFRKDVYYSFEEWKNNTGFDKNSTFLGSPLGKNESIEMFYNTSKNVQPYQLNGAVAKNVDGTPVSKTFELQPFTSVILIGKNLSKIKTSSNLLTGY